MRAIGGRFPSRLRLLLLLMAGAGLLAACEQDSASPAPRMSVEVFEVGSAVIKREKKFHGRVVPADLTRVAFRIPGKVAHLSVQAGQRVQAGQVLAQIEDSIQRQGVADAQARYRLSKRQLQRAENLHQRGALTSAQRDQLQAAFRLATAQLELATVQLGYTVVKAPFDGMVSEVSKELYEAVAVGETVFSVYRYDRTDVLVNVPDILPARIHQARDISAMEVRGVFSGSAQAYKLHYLKGSTARNPRTQTFQFWVSMPAGEEAFPPGLPVTVTTDLQEAGFSTEAGIIVPLGALQAGETAKEFRVWRIDNDVVNPAVVQVGSITQAGALISAGLQPGELLVNGALSRLSPGQRVNIPSDRRGTD